MDNAHAHVDRYDAEHLGREIIGKAWRAEVEGVCGEVRFEASTSIMA